MSKLDTNDYSAVIIRSYNKIKITNRIVEYGNKCEVETIDTKNPMENKRKVYKQIEELHRQKINDCMTYCTIPEGIKINTGDALTNAFFQTIINLPLFFNKIKVNVIYHDTFSSAIETIVITGNKNMDGGSGLSRRLYAYEDRAFLEKEVGIVKNDKEAPGDLSLDDEVGGRLKKGARITTTKDLKKLGIEYIIHTLDPTIVGINQGNMENCKKLFFII